MIPLQNLDRYNVMLASASPRRRELLQMLGIKFETARGLQVDESYPADMEVEEIPVYLSRVKADAYREEMQPDDLIITADTVVVVDTHVLGKPKSKAEAVAMLKELRGRSHKVISGVTVTTAERRESFGATTVVEFNNLSDDEIEYYVDNYKPLDKAGAYGIQEWIGAAGVRGIKGSFYNVMGLPVNRLYEVLKTF